MLSDSFFQQGVTHEVCEDYALHGEGYAIVSDGCSGAEHTDWGARLLSKAGEHNLFMIRRQSATGIKEFLTETAAMAKRQAKEFPGLPPESLTATLALAYNDLDVIRTLVIGDGVVGARKHDGSWEITTYEPVMGGCYYLKYMMFDGQTSMYFDMYKGKHKVTTYTGRFGVEWAKVEEELDITPEEPYFKWHFPISDYELVFVGSDGWSQFFKKVNTGTSKHNEPVPVLDSLEVIFDGIASRPGFLRLQRQWAFKRPLPGTYVRRDWHSADDASLAAVIG